MYKCTVYASYSYVVFNETIDNVRTHCPNRIPEYSCVGWITTSTVLYLSNLKFRYSLQNRISFVTDFSMLECAMYIQRLSANIVPFDKISYTVALFLNLWPKNLRSRKWLQKPSRAFKVSFTKIRQCHNPSIRNTKVLYVWCRRHRCFYMPKIYCDLTGIGHFEYTYAHIPPYRLAHIPPFVFLESFYFSHLFQCL